jgi:uncharacterized BrkB/YihY/UPF0761 family membrane protein
VSLRQQFALGFMMWLWISAIIILLGAEIDAESE